MNAPTPDTSPGDEQQLEKALIDLYESAMLHGAAQANGVLPTQSQREQTVIVAKDRLNRLMLTRVKGELEKLIQPSEIHGYFVKYSGNDIHERVKAIDAQLNKEEN